MSKNSLSWTEISRERNKLSLKTLIKYCPFSLPSLHWTGKQRHWTLLNPLEHSWTLLNTSRADFIKGRTDGVTWSLLYLYILYILYVCIITINNNIHPPSHNHLQSIAFTFSLVFTQTKYVAMWYCGMLLPYKRNGLTASLMSNSV